MKESLSSIVTVFDLICQYSRKKDSILHCFNILKSDINPGSGSIFVFNKKLELLLLFSLNTVSE